MPPERAPELSPNDQVQFLNFHRPRLRSGDYALTIEQRVMDGDITAKSTQYFSVAGQRFALESSDIHLVYPPPHSQGDFDRTLPHIVFNSDTLPWQRTPRGDSQDEILSPTWLALLVFTKDEDKAIQQRTGTVKDLVARVDFPSDVRSWLWPGIRKEVGQHDEDGVTLIGVPWPILRAQLPTYQDLYSTAHVRKICYTDEAPGSPVELSVIVAARLPPPDTACVAYLVSLEHRYDDANRTNCAYPDGQNVFRFPRQVSDAQNQMRKLLKTVEKQLYEQEQALQSAIASGGGGPERSHALAWLREHLAATVVLAGGETPIALAPNMAKAIADIGPPLTKAPGGTSLLTEAQVKPYLPDPQADLEPDGHSVSYELRVADIGTLRIEAHAPLARTLHGHLVRSLVVKIWLPDASFRLNWHTSHPQNATYTPVCCALLSLLNEAHTRGATELSVMLEAGKLPRVMTAQGIWQEANFPDLKPATADAAKALALALLAPQAAAAASALAPTSVWVQFADGEQAEVKVNSSQGAGDTTIAYLSIRAARERATMSDAYKLPGSDDPQNRPPLIVLAPGLPAIWHSPLNLTSRGDSGAEALGQPDLDNPSKAMLEQMCLGMLNRRATWQKHYIQRGSLDLSQDIEVNRRVIRAALQLSGDTASARANIQIAPVVRLYFDHQGAEGQPGADPPLVQLASLHRWEFECSARGRNFVGLLEGLDGVKGSAELQLRHDLGAAPKESGAAAGLSYLRAGYTPLPHRMREGSRTISWYRGPLMPRLPVRSDANTLPLPAHSADGLLIYDQASGMFDSSYAAAWELGRTLALADTRFATQLYHWKRAYAHSIARQLQYVDHSYLPGQHHLPQADELPQPLADWLDALTRLEGVPFNYLIPAEALLPVESIRFFDLDPLWVECLRDGALSLGRVLQVNHSRDVEIHDGSLPDQPEVAGFLLRSQVVAHYPKLEVAGFSLTQPRIDELQQSPNWSDQSHVDGLAGIARLPVLRLARLAPDLLLGLYVGKLDMLEFHLPPQILHFGLEVPDAPDQYRTSSTTATPLVKMLRDPRSGDLLDFVVDGRMVDDNLIDFVRLGPRDISQALAADTPGGPVPAEILYLLIITAHDKTPCLGPVTFPEDKSQYQASLSSLMGTPYDSAEEPYKSIEAQIKQGNVANTLTVDNLRGLKAIWESTSGPVWAERWDWLLRLALRGMGVITLTRKGDQTPHEQLRSLFAEACEACKGVEWAASPSESKTTQAGALKRLWWYVDKHVAETIVIDTTFWHDREHNAEWVDPQPKDFDSTEYWDIRKGQILNFKHLFDTVADRLAPALGGRAITAGDFALQMLDAAPLVRFVRLPPTEGAE